MVGVRTRDGSGGRDDDRSGGGGVAGRCWDRPGAGPHPGGGRHRCRAETRIRPVRGALRHRDDEWDGRRRHGRCRVERTGGHGEDQRRRGRRPHHRVGAVRRRGDLGRRRRQFRTPRLWPGVPAEQLPGDRRGGRACAGRRERRGGAADDAHLRARRRRARGATADARLRPADERSQTRAARALHRDGAAHRGHHGRRLGPPRAR